MNTILQEKMDVNTFSEKMKKDVYKRQVAAGAGASTKIVLKEPVPSGRGNQKLTRLMRIENVKAIDAYIDRIDEMIERKGEWLWR